MKNTICQAIWFALVIGVPMIFTVNGLGVDTWQWWTLTLGMAAAYSVGVVRGMD